MSDILLTNAQVKLLSKGLKFTPTPKSNTPELESDIKEFCRRLRLKENFYNSEDSDSDHSGPLLRNKSNWNPQPKRVPILDNCIEILQKTAEEIEPIPLKPSKDNLTREERSALMELKKNDKIIIKEADKGGAICIMNKDFYASKITEMLNDPQTYKETSNPTAQQTLLKIKKLANKYSDCLKPEESDYITKFHMKESNLYGLPKIHKSKIIKEAINKQNSEYITAKDPSDLKFRPIVAGPISATSRISELVDCILKDIPQHTKSFIRDDIHFLSKLNRSLAKDENYELVTFDVESLYTNIDKDVGLKAIRFWMKKHRDKIDPRFSEDFVCDAIRIILENNTFRFDNKSYLQIKGTAMGTKMAPTYANLVLAYLEEMMYEKMETNLEYCNFIKENHLRYLDDCFIVWPTSKWNLDEFERTINNLHPSFKFTRESHHSQIAFLDIIIYIENHKLLTDVYYKPTDTHQYLHFKSCHPRHTIHNIPYAQARRLCTIIDDVNRKEQKLNEMKQFFLDQGYPGKLIEDGIKKAKAIPQSTLRQVKPKQDEDALPFVFSHNPCNPNLVPLVRSSLDIMKTNPRMKKVLQRTRFIPSKRQTKNLGNILTRASFNSNEKMNHGSFKCNDKRCRTCPYMNEGKTIRITSTGRDFNIKERMNCKTQNVLYIITCNGCHSQYVGMTTDNLSNRVRVHKQQINHAEYRQINVSEHIDLCSKQDIKFTITPFYKLTGSKTSGLIKESMFIKQFKPSLNR